MRRQFTLFDDEGTVIKSTTYSEEGLNAGWVVMYQRGILSLLNKCKELTKLKVFMFLASQQTFDSIVVTNMAFVARELKMSYKSAWLAVKWLEENKVLKRVVKNGVSGFLLNPKYTTCGRKSLKEKRALWKILEDNPQRIDSKTGEIFDVELPVTDEEIEGTNNLIHQVFGVESELQLPDDEEEIYDPFGFQGDDEK